MSHTHTSIRLKAVPALPRPRHDQMQALFFWPQLLQPHVMISSLHLLICLLLLLHHHHHHHHLHLLLDRFNCSLHSPSRLDGKVGLPTVHPFGGTTTSVGSFGIMLMAHQGRLLMDTNSTTVFLWHKRVMPCHDSETLTYAHCNCMHHEVEVLRTFVLVPFMRKTAHPRDTCVQQAATRQLRASSCESVRCTSPQGLLTSAGRQLGKWNALRWPISAALHPKLECERRASV